MICVFFDGCNVDLEKPKFFSDEQWYTKPAQRGFDDDGFPYYETAWLPNIDDIKNINAGKPIRLRIICNSEVGGPEPFDVFTRDEDKKIEI